MSYSNETCKRSEICMFRLIQLFASLYRLYITTNNLPGFHNWLYVFGGRGRTRTDADGRGRTRTDADGRGRTRTRTRTDADADGRGHFYKIIIFFFCVFFWAYIDLRGQLERDPESDRLGPPTHHDLMKIY